MALRVLIVDDQQDFVESLAEPIRAWGYEVQTALDGNAAIEIASHFQPNVILLDIMMPEMDGYKVAKKLREVVDFKNCTIIGVTALGSDAHRYQGYDAGFHHYEVKPVDPEKIKNMLMTVERSLVIEAEQRQGGMNALAEKLAGKKKKVS